ncbi:MAG: nitroreductase/quinone reductase family protein [Sphingomonadaceae bacterium]
MSDAESEAIREKRGDWVTEHREKYLNSGGAEGHIEDLTPVNGHSFGTHILLKYVGRKTGRTFITPLCYADIGGEVIICASKGGADSHPAWYLNLVSRPEVEFQIATQAFKGTWREAEGEEREKLLAFMTECFPFYGDYQGWTERKLPIIAMKAVEPIPVFKMEDADAWRDG